MAPMHPEWAGYLAAFDAYVIARKGEDDELAEQARLLMGYFASDLLEEQGVNGPRSHPRMSAGDLWEAVRVLGL